jgi:hypothetical protein
MSDNETKPHDEATPDDERELTAEEVFEQKFRGAHGVCGQELQRRLPVLVGRSRVCAVLQ